MYERLQQRERRHEQGRRRTERRESVTDPDFVFLHLAKNGGGAIRDFLTPIAGRWYHAGHRATVPELVERFPGAPIVFFVRHPVSRFVSGFNNFLRHRIQKGHKLPNDPLVMGHHWFGSPDELACALASDDERTRSAAEYVMTNMAFLKMPMVRNLLSTDSIDAHLPHIRFIGTQEDFTESVDAMRRALALPQHLALSVDDVSTHRAPETLSKFVSERGRAALLEWFHEDVVLYDHCVTIHQQHMQEFAP